MVGRTIVVGAVLMVALATAACGDDDATTTASEPGTDTTEFTGDGAPPEGGTTTAAPGATYTCAPALDQSLDQVNEMFGREADYNEDGGGIADLYVWYFGDSGQVAVSAFDGVDEVADWKWHDGNGFRFQEPLPACPLPPAADGHPREQLL